MTLDTLVRMKDVWCLPTTRLLIIHAPAADAYFAELQALWSGASPPTLEQEGALMRRHGLEPVEQDSKAKIERGL